MSIKQAESSKHVARRIEYQIQEEGAYVSV
jgi:hypothetical protein